MIINPVTFWWFLQLSGQEAQIHNPGYWKVFFPVLFDVPLAPCGLIQNMFAKIIFPCWSECFSALELFHWFPISHHIQWPAARAGGRHLLDLRNLVLLILGWKVPGSSRQNHIFLSLCNQGERWGKKGNKLHLKSTLEWKAHMLQVSNLYNGYLLPAISSVHS